jgi:DNA repair protein RecN (Recombination protein N)
MGRSKKVIERLLAFDLVGFDKIDLNFEQGLVVFTGPSGAGKSVLISAILSLIAQAKPSASLCEISLDIPSGFHCEDFEIEDEIVLKAVQKDKIRYYLNDQTISKNRLKELFSNHIKHLSVRDNGQLSNLVELLDIYASKHDGDFEKKYTQFQERFSIYKAKESELFKVLDDEKKVQDLIEFAKFEIEKIESINPRTGEDEELMDIKHKLSKIDKIKDAIAKAQAVFEYENAVTQAYELMQKDASVFDEAMNQLRSDFEAANDMIDELGDIDIENVLDRIEQIGELKRRFGSVFEALEYLKQKKAELAEYENLSFTKESLQKFVQSEKKALLTQAETISNVRKKAAKSVEKELNEYLNALRLTPVKFVFAQKDMDEKGIDSVDLDLKGSTIKTLSGGEFNRVRLALLVVKSALSDQKGVIILDEIDANVSGDESIAIANMIKKLSCNYQIFAISHQPHVTAAANQHFLVYKDGVGKSFVKALQGEDRTNEVARIIGGEKPSAEALSFAKKVLA